MKLLSYLFSQLNVEKKKLFGRTEKRNEALKDLRPVGFLETMMLCDD